LPTAVHQFLPSLAPRDAVGNHTVATSRALRRAGVSGRIWAEYVHPDLLRAGRHYRGYPGRLTGLRPPRRALLYQASTGTDGLVDFLVRRPEPLALYYHNVTPAEFFDPYDATAAARSRQGREELRRLVPRATSVLTASEFNARELRALGVDDVVVVLPYIGSGSPARPDPELETHLRAGKRGIDLLFVGRMMPHKGLMHLLRVVAALRAGGEAPVRLFLVGASGPRSFMASLRRLRETLRLEGAVFITGSLPEGQLAAHYAAADLFVCLSEHEGFCIPLLEAMRSGLPVVAYDAGAVGETLGGTGVLLGTLDALVVAEAVHRVTGSDVLGSQLRDRQRARAAELDVFDRDGALLRALRPIIES
jgi:glycosyltransferase involved in cell wall biosynthesis